MFWLWMMPLISISQLEVATGFTNNRVHRLLIGLIHEGLVVRCTLSGGRRKQERWWLASAGVTSLRQARGFPIPWQVTEPGIMKLITRMAVVEALYDLALGIWAHEGVIADHPVHEMPDLGSGPTFLNTDLELTEFIWYGEGEVDAVAVYTNGAWLAMAWAGPETTYHQLLTRAGKSSQTPGATWHPQLGRRLTPAGWAIVCADRLSAAQAGEAWPDDNVLAVTVDGHVEKSMRPGDFSLRIKQTPVDYDLGRPERAVRWAERDPAVQGLNDRLAYAVFRFVAEWRAATPAQLKRRFGDRYGATVRELQKRRLIVKLDGGFYITKRGMRALAAIDGVDYQTVLDRLGVFLQKDGKYRRQQQRHDQTLIDVMWKFESEGLPTFAGDRHRLILPGLPQVAPDAVTRVDRKDGRSLLVRVELEFTATDRERRWEKREPYVVANIHLKELIVSAWLFENRRVAQSYFDDDPYLLMMVAVLDEFFAGTSRGPDSVWELYGERQSIDDLEYIVDREWTD